ncbi:hypothetical protein [Nocardia sp. NPDC050435]|uniref:hypothetical protein n=1 Tax=Nocardia sp. NPDC050435 TaxID=3155040 RepID=UPI0033F85A2F
MATELLALGLQAGAIYAVTLDSRRVRTIVQDLNAAPDGIVVDQDNGHIYWTSMGVPDQHPPSGRELTFFDRNGMIERVDFDGRNRTTIVTQGAFTTGKQITADFAAGRLYWCDREGMQVLTCDLSGADLHPLVVTGRGPDDARIVRNWPVGISLDPVQRLLYWTQKGAPKAGDGRIFRVPLDLPTGADPYAREDIELLWQDLPEPIDLELDAANGKLLWTDRGGEPDGNTLNRGALVPEPGPVEVLARGFHEAIGLAAVSATQFYVSDLGGAVRLVDLIAGTHTVIARPGGALTGLALAEF